MTSVPPGFEDFKTAAAYAGVMIDHGENGVIVALDHGLHWGVLDGFEDPDATLRAVLDGNPDGVLASVPFLEHFEGILDENPAVTRLGTVDVLYDSTVPGERAGDEIHFQGFDVGRAARAGADGVKACMVFGREDPEVLATNAEFAATLTETAREHGLAAVLEPVLWGDRIGNDTDPDLIEHGARLGMELGADVLKLYYPGQERLQSIVDHSPCPVYVAGGPGGENDLSVLEMTANAVHADASGIIYGRKIWQHEDPAAMVRALDAVVNDGASATDALAYLE